MSQLNIGLGYRSDTSHGQDFKPFFSSLFLCTIPIFEGYKITLQRYKMIEMQIQGWRCKGFEDSELSILLHFHRFRSSSLIRHFTSNITIFFPWPITRRAYFGHNLGVISKFLFYSTSLFMSQPNIGLGY